MVFPRGEEHPHWKGDDAKASSGRARARKVFTDPEPCERCGGPGEQRHHRDEDPLNNAPENIEWICASCHTTHHQLKRWADRPPEEHERVRENRRRYMREYMRRRRAAQKE